MQGKVTAFESMLNDIISFIEVFSI